MLKDLCLSGVTTVANGEYRFYNISRTENVKWENRLYEFGLEGWNESI
jgi:hypothetical protein